MTCSNCIQAKTKPHWPIFQQGCRGCSIRALATGPEVFEAGQLKQITPAYRAALEVLFGDGWEAAHQEVKAEQERLRALRTP